ncbi:hypothetical protein CF327_g5960 [Tilletia walkeri]|nr:hypothetical protein CF327_g5960 [Tilletia walkeri]
MSNKLHPDRTSTSIYPARTLMRSDSRIQEADNILLPVATTALQILVRQGIRARRWPRLNDGQPHLDVIPEVLALVATICNSTPRAALKLTQQTNIADTLLRFIALPPWGLDDSEGEAKASTETDSERWMLRN